MKTAAAGPLVMLVVSLAILALGVAFAPTCTAQSERGPAIGAVYRLAGCQ